MLQGDSPRMPCIHTSIHDAPALAATCRQLGAPAPQQGCIQLDALEASGWIVRLRDLNFPIVCDTLTGLVAYHPRDNAFVPYRAIMRFVHAFYAVRHRLHRSARHGAFAHHRSRCISVAG